jgi:hypothetical protein
VAADSAWERKLLEEALHPGQVLALIGVNLGIGSFEISIGKDGRCAVARPGNENRIQVIFVDKAVEMDVGEGLTGIRAPMAQESRLRVLNLQRLP